MITRLEVITIVTQNSGSHTAAVGIAGVLVGIPLGLWQNED